jgi:hypothetical protein
LSESVRKLLKQIQRMYERDTQFQNNLDKLMENSQVIKLNYYFAKMPNFKRNLKFAYFSPEVKKSIFSNRLLMLIF